MFNTETKHDYYRKIFRMNAVQKQAEIDRMKKSEQAAKRSLNYSANAEEKKFNQFLNVATIGPATVAELMAFCELSFAEQMNKLAQMAGTSGNPFGKKTPTVLDRRLSTATPARNNAAYAPNGLVNPLAFDGNFEAFLDDANKR